jgi:hypothetical protein
MMNVLRSSPAPSTATRARRRKGRMKRKETLKLSMANSL